MTDATTASLTCPKCEAAMKTYERNGVTIEQCTECRGIFLDRGELERLVDAEGAFYAGAAEPPRGGQGDSGGYFDERSRDREHGGKRRREGFLGELFG